MVTFTYSNRYKYALMKKLLDISSDSIKVLLMRSGFVFNKDNHATLINIKTTSGALTGILDIDVAAKTFHRDSGSFVTDGFVVGNKLTVTGTTDNNGTYTIVTVSASDIVVSEALPGTNQSNGNGTIVSNDELATAGGYTQDTKTTGAVTMTEEDDANDRCDATFPTVSWTAAGANIGPTPGAILYDDTAAENTIIGYFDFDGEVTTVPPDSLHIGNGTLRLA